MHVISWWSMACVTCAIPWHVASATCEITWHVDLVAPIFLHHNSKQKSGRDSPDDQQEFGNLNNFLTAAMSVYHYQDQHQRYKTEQEFVSLETWWYLFQWHFWLGWRWVGGGGSISLMYQRSQLPCQCINPSIRDIRPNRSWWVLKPGLWSSNRWLWLLAQKVNGTGKIGWRPP